MTVSSRGDLEVVPGGTEVTPSYSSPAAPVKCAGPGLVVTKVESVPMRNPIPKVPRESEIRALVHILDALKLITKLRDRPRKEGSVLRRSRLRSLRDRSEEMRAQI